MAVATAISASCSSNDDQPSDRGTSPPPVSTGEPPQTSLRPTTTSTAPATASSTAAPPPPTVSVPAERPVWEHDFPDPFVLEVAGRYYAYGTEAGLIHIQRLAGDSPARFADLREALPDLPPWAEPFSSWAPAVAEIDGRFLLYYTVLVAGTDKHCIGVGVSDTPEGPFVDRSQEPLLCPEDLGGAIDPSPFLDEDGRWYLLWKNDGVTLRRDSSIWSQPLSGDGRSLTGPAVRLLDTDQRWEYPHIEAPSMVRVGDRYWLAYSGNWWNQEAYGVGLARCPSPRERCEKPFDGPVLSSRPGALGPGGLEFFRVADGRIFAAYHAWPTTPGYPGARALWIDEVDTSGDGLALKHARR